MKRFFIIITIILFFSSSFISCINKFSSNQEMTELIANISKTENVKDNPFSPEASLLFWDSVAHSNDLSFKRISVANYNKAVSYLKLGEEEKAVPILEQLLSETDSSVSSAKRIFQRELAICYLRMGERANCIHNHSGASCVFPIKGEGVHADPTGSLKAVNLYEAMLDDDPQDLESRWLINIGYMTLGAYPASVPEKYLIKGLDQDSAQLVKPFYDMAVRTGLNTKNMAGGSIIDDFDNDGYPDIVSSSWDLHEGMHFCKNNGNGTFSDISGASGLQQLTGGLNMMQTNYNNDGLKDIFILRGAWKGAYGKEPRSLLKNNGDGSFTDVTKEAGLLSLHPSQTATWNDFNNDGWLDVYIGNESEVVPNENACQLYINNKNGTFSEVAAKSATDIIAFVKGVTSGDYDNDGLVDLFVSTMNKQSKMLLRNTGSENGIPHFENVTWKAGLSNCNVSTFATWFWDYDNDGWLDLFVCNYDFQYSQAYYAAAEALHLPTGNSAKQFLYRNKHNGTFEDVSEKAGLNKIAFTMGSNFGDIDNDGYPDIYLGTGSPHYQSLVPNKMFKNLGNGSFADVTKSARVGNLQKGHGVSFCDLDNDGDEDIYIDMGGAYKGDAYENSLFINPGQNNNGWINVKLEGAKTNRAAIGAKVKVTFSENGKQRSVYRDVNSGGSFGSNPLVQHIGIGSAKRVESVTITWPVSHTVQTFTNISPGDYIAIKEGDVAFEKIILNGINFLSGRIPVGCSPN